MDKLAQQLASRLAKRYGKSRPPGGLKPPLKAEIEERTVFTPDAPAPRLAALQEQRGPELTAEALVAWNQRLSGIPIVDVAHDLGVSIETAKHLIREVQQAITDDLKESVAQNREMDLARIDAMIRTWYPAAVSGCEVSANVMIKLLAQRAKLTGAASEPPELKTVQPQNILVWIQQQMPQINRIVDSLPIE